MVHPDGNEQSEKPHIHKQECGVGWTLTPSSIGKTPIVTDNRSAQERDPTLPR